MDTRIFELTRTLERTRGRVDYCRRQLERFDSRADPGDVMLARARDRLAEDLRQAEADAGWAMIALADATSPMEVPA